MNENKYRKYHKFSHFMLRVWYRSKPSFLAYCLWPLSILYQWVVCFRKCYYQCRLKHSGSVKVLVVGNITLGGVGKTPLVVMLVKFYQKKGHKLAIVSRGYKGNYQGVLELNAETQVECSGDEAYMLYWQTQVPVFLSRDRQSAVDAIVKKYPQISMIISDDGLQHYAMHRDYEIVVVDGGRNFGNGFCLPAGPLREPISRLDSVDLVIKNGQDMWMKPLKWRHLMSGQSHQLSAFLGHRVVVISGIGNPERFYQTLKDLGYEDAEYVEFPDHHKFSAEDLAKYTGNRIFVTEKDAVKLLPFRHHPALSHVYALYVKAECSDKILSVLEGFG